MILRLHIADRVFGQPGVWEPLAGGSINEAWCIHPDRGDAAIVRIGPSASVVRQGPSWMRANALGCELHLLDRVRPHLSQVPGLIAAGFLPGERPWVVQEMVSGVLFSRVLTGLPRDDVLEIWHQVGALVRRIHQIPAPWFGTPDGREVFPDWPAMVAHDVEGLLADQEKWDLAPDPFHLLVTLVERHRDILAEVSQPCAVHSDLDPRHVFVEETSHGWRISGVIDWEYGRYVDPMSESLLVNMLDRPEQDPERAAFFDGYGDIVMTPETRHRLAIYRAIARCWELTDATRQP